MKPHYYLMKNKKILRLEQDEPLENLSSEVFSNILDQDNIISMNQDQANWRVAIFRDEIMELQDYLELLMEEKKILTSINASAN